MAKDTSSHGSRRSLAFIVAWFKQRFRETNRSLRWTAIDNRLSDCLTKKLDSSHLRSTLTRGSWSVSYSSDFAKATMKAMRPLKADEAFEVRDLFGMAIDGPSPLLTWSRTKPGWHTEDTRVFQVSRGAKALRIPEPRYSCASFPSRTTFACFTVAATQRWRRLEDEMNYVLLPNVHRKTGGAADLLISIFEPQGPKPLEHFERAICARLDRCSFFSE